MDARYAFFIWASFGVAALAVVWNVIAPMLARNQIRQRLSEARDDNEGNLLMRQSTKDDVDSFNDSPGPDSHD